MSDKKWNSKAITTVIQINTTTVTKIHKLARINVSLLDRLLATDSLASAVLANKLMCSLILCAL